MNSNVDYARIKLLATVAGFKVDEENISQIVNFYMLVMGEMSAEIMPMFKDFVAWSKQVKENYEARGNLQ